MLPIGARPMIARLIDRLAAGGVTDVALALGFKPEPFVEAFPDGRCGECALDYAVEPEPLDTAGAIRFAADHAGIDDTFVVANGDVLTDLDVSHLVATHRRLGGRGDDPSDRRRRPVELRRRRHRRDGHGVGPVRAFVEKPRAGHRAEQPDQRRHLRARAVGAVDRMPAGVQSSIERDVFPRSSPAAACYGVATDDYWIDAGRPELYLRANLDLVDGVRRFERVRRRSTPGAEVDASALVRNSIVGAAARIARDARIIDSVVLPGAVVGRGVLRRAIARDGRRRRRRHGDRDAVIGAEGRRRRR